MSSPALAVQLYTVRSLLEEDLDGTLRKLAATGAEAVETAGFHGRSAAEFRAALDAAGLRACSAHVRIDRLEEAPEATLEDLRALGAETLVVPIVPAPANAAEADAAAARIAAATAPAVEAGVRVAYHNHHFEFSTLDDGSTLWDRVSARDAGWLLEPDAGWLRVAGRDPVEVLREHAGRCPLVHAKDVRPVGPEWTDVPVGDGVLDWPGIVAAAREGGTEWLVAEFDTPTEDTLGDIGRSLDALRRVLRGVTPLGVGVSAAARSAPST